MTALPATLADLRPTDPWWKHRAAWFYDAVLAGEMRDYHSAQVPTLPLSRESLGRLEFPGGQVVAGDPYLMDAEPTAFVQRLSVEAAEVIAVRALVGTDHERVAALMLVAGDGPIKAWDLARFPGQDLETLDGESYFGYGVDAGTGSLGSPAAMAVAGRVLLEDEGMLEDPISEALFEDGLGTRSAVIVAPEAGAVPIAACSSGWGDGSYPTWLGLDEAGDVVAVVTDFLIAGDPHATDADRPDSEPAASPSEEGMNRSDPEPKPESEPDPAPRPSLFRRLFGR